MPSSDKILRDYFRPLFEHPAWHGTAAFGSWLRLNFGEPHLVVREPSPDAVHRSLRRRYASVVGSHQLWVEMGAWTLHHNARVYAHSESSRRRLEHAAASLEGQVLTELRCGIDPLETKFSFDGGSELRVYPTDDAEPDDPLWHLYSGSRMVELLANGELRYGQIARNAPNRCPVTDTPNPSFQRTATPPLN